MIEKQDLEFQYDINIDVKLLIFKKNNQFKGFLEKNNIYNKSNNNQKQIF